MRTLSTLALVLALTAGVAPAQETPKPAAPQKEHGWLKQLEGEWVTEAEMVMPDGKTEKSAGTESVRSIGGFWIVSEMKGDCMGTPFVGLMTVGFDGQKKQYVGSWVCSMCDHSCAYEGSVDETGKVLTLNTEAPSPVTGKLTKMRDVIEIKSGDHRVLSSYLLGDDGKWVKFMTMTARAK